MSLLSAGRGSPRQARQADLQALRLSRLSGSRSSSSEDSSPEVKSESLSESSSPSAALAFPCAGRSTVSGEGLDCVSSECPV